MGISTRPAGRTALLVASLGVLAAVVPLAAHGAPVRGVERPAAAADPATVELPLGSRVTVDLDLPVVRELQRLLPVPLPAATGVPPRPPPTPGESAARAPLRRLDPLTVTNRPAPRGRAGLEDRREAARRHRGAGLTARGAARPRRTPPAAVAVGSGATRAPRVGRAPPERIQRDRAGPRVLETVPAWSRPIIGVLLMAVALGLRSLFAGARARRLEQQRNSLLNDVQVMQRALVPEVPERLGELRISAAYCPAEGPGAGGDFYDAFPLADGSVGLIIGDVAGHGRSALERATLTRYTVRAYVEAGLEPRAALRLAERVLGDSSEAGFVTVAVAVIDASAGLLTYALAGHHPPLLLGAGMLEPLSACSSPPLGLGLPSGLRQTTISLSEEAVVCFFTDGVIEARVGDGMLGRESLERLLVMLGPGPDAAGLLSHAVDHATDDRAVCIVRGNNGPGMVARPPHMPFHMEELELEESTGRADRSRFLSSCGLAPDVVAKALDEAQRSPPGTLVRVWVAPRGSTVKVVPPEPDQRERGSAERPATRWLSGHPQFPSVS